MDTTVATSIVTSTAFLYTGSDPIQTGVAPGTIEARRVAVLRGRLLTCEDTNLSGSLRGIVLEVFVAGRSFSSRFPAEPNQTIWQVWKDNIGLLDVRGQGLGGWSLNVHHTYDPGGKILYLGDGTIRSAEVMGYIITTVAGNGSIGFNGEGGPATQASLSMPADVAIGQDGSIYIADSFHYRIRRMDPPLPGFSNTDFVLPSEDSRELYAFDSVGRHMSTLNTLTGTVRYQFGYDNTGRLVNITDGDGNVVTIERDMTGNATAIAAPYGQSTGMTTNTNSYLTSITNPMGESVHLIYTSEGLLINLTDPRGNIHNFSYDTPGRLIRDEDPAGGFKTLSLTEMVNYYSFTLATRLNRNKTYQVELLSTGDLKRVNTFPNGLKTETRILTNGSSSINMSNGAHITLVHGPDPRFGMLVPVLSRLTLTMPSGLTGTITINDRTFTSTFNATWNNITSRTPHGQAPSQEVFISYITTISALLQRA